MKIFFFQKSLRCSTDPDLIPDTDMSRPSLLAQTPPPPPLPSHCLSFATLNCCLALGFQEGVFMKIKRVSTFLQECVPSILVLPQAALKVLHRDTAILGVILFSLYTISYFLSTFLPVVNIKIQTFYSLIINFLLFTES